MGMYTEIYVKVSLIENVDPIVIHTLSYMMGMTDSKPERLPNHPLFRSLRWEHMLRCSSHYHVPKSVGEFWYNDIAKQWFLVSRSDFKNYDSEVELFFDWIKDYVEADYGYKKFIGYSLYEEDSEPVLYYAGEEICNAN